MVDPTVLYIKSMVFLLGGNSARADAEEHRANSTFDVVRVTCPGRPDLLKQMKAMLLDAKDLTCETFEPKDIEPDLGPLGRAMRAHAKERVSVKAVADDCGLDVSHRAKLDAHITLWRRVAKTGKPTLILEDGLVLATKIGAATAHLVAAIDRVCDPETVPVVLLLAASVNPQEGWKPQWMPTDLAMSGGDKILLREPATVHDGASCAYVVWPLAARRMLSALPLRTSLNTCINHHLQNETVRALAVHPALGAPALDPYVPPVPKVLYKVCFKPRVAIRSKADPNGLIVSSASFGDVIEVIERSPDGGWVRIADRPNGEKQWVMLAHPELGPLLERADSAGVRTPWV